MENGFIESFNGRLRNQCLNVEGFASLDACGRMEDLQVHHIQMRSQQGNDIAYRWMGDRKRVTQSAESKIEFI